MKSISFFVTFFSDHTITTCLVPLIVSRKQKRNNKISSFVSELEASSGMHFQHSKLFQSKSVFKGRIECNWKENNISLFVHCCLVIIGGLLKKHEFDNWIVLCFSNVFTTHTQPSTFYIYRCNMIELTIRYEVLV